LTRIVRLFVFVLMSGAVAAGAGIAAAQASGSAATVASPTAGSPVAHVRDARSWEYGPFVNYGNGVGGDERSQYKFLSAGLQLGKPVTPVLHAGVFSGQFEFGANIMPLWQAYTPAPHTATYSCIVGGTPTPCTLAVAGGTYRGVSLTPVIFRWNFLTKSRRIQPWFQGAGGLIYTTHEFPPSYQSSPITITGQTYRPDGSTSVWNFSPQGGVGIHYFTRDKRSIDLGINAVHISSASLGDRNPGVNASIQLQVGYTFWK
jgi:lipid A 3-O-deacylase